MRYSTIASILVFCALFVWINDLHSQTNTPCDCLNETPTLTDQPQDITICEGDTVQLSFDAAGRTSFPIGYFFEKVGNQATQLFKYDFETGTMDTIPLTMGQMGDVRGGTYIGGDTLAVILASGRLFYVFDDTTSVSIDMVYDFPTRSGYEWQGLHFDRNNRDYYAIAGSADTSILYQLDTSSMNDTIFLERFIGRFRGLSDFVTLDISIDSLVYLVPGSTIDIVDIGMDIVLGQGLGYDMYYNEFYMSLFDGTNGYLGYFPDSLGEVCIFDTIGTEQIRPLILLPSDTFERDRLTVSWTPMDSLSDPDSFSTLAYPSNTTTYTYTVTDICGNSTSDTVRVTVNQTPNPLMSQSCIAMVNTSLGANCLDTVEPSEILTPDYVCADEFFVAIIDGRPEPILVPSDVGDTITVRIEPQGGGNSCWSSVVVEDKLEPTIECENDTIDFDEEPTPPQTSDNCDNDVRIDTLNLEFIQISPCDPDLLYGTRETVVAVDDSGNRSDTCQREVYVRRPEIDDVVFPDSFSLESNNPISCETNFPTVPNSPYPSPDFTGEPETTEGILINDLPAEYNVDAYFNDVQASPISSCKTSVRRIWHVVAWICSNPDTIASYVQLIEVVDTTGPEFTCPADYTASTSGNSCSASVSIPYPNATDNCSSIDRVTVSYPMGFIPDLQPGGATIELDPGMNDITYTVYDECLNSTSCTYTIEVQDLNGPTAICREPNVGLNQNGPTRVYASSFDDGSFDDCGIDRIEVARMSPSCNFEAEFGPYVEFNCCDVGTPVMIILRAFDESGNFNDCMTEINVQDKTAAQIVAPDNIEVSCEYPIDTSDLSEFGKVVVTDNPDAVQNRSLEPAVDSILLTDTGLDPVMERFYGLDGVAYDNCDLTIETSTFVEEMSCNRMRIERTFTALANGIPQASDVQVIIVENIGGFTEDQITWPLDTMIVGSCGGQSIHPDSLGGVHGFPEIDESPCSSVMLNYEDELFYSLTPGDEVCYKVLRTWRVLDWCTSDRNGDPRVFTDVQLIKVVNTQGPVFEQSPDSLTVCSTAPECDPGFIALQQSANDDCTAQNDLIWRYQIDEFNDGSINDFGNSPDASGIYPIGTHRIIWTVEDECGNETDRIQYFTIESCLLPSVILESGIILELTPMDLDNDGINETGMNQITAEHIGWKSSHQCGYEVHFSFSPIDLNDTLRVFDCDDVGIQELTIYVTDINGRQDFGRTYVAIQDNQLVCGNDPGPIFPITGNISGTSGKKLSNTTVKMEGDAQFEAITDDEGKYTFPSMPGGGTYLITPVKNDEILNGVSTFDILLIQQFILGLNDLDDPLQHIAADIDNNTKISGSDIIELRKLILGIEDEFSANESWRFVDANFIFGNGNPLTQNFPESYHIPDLNASMSIDFEAVKIGDVNNSATFHSNSPVVRNSNTEFFVMPDERLSSGEIIRIPVYANEGYENIFGFQLEWSYNASIIEQFDITPGQLDVQASNLNESESGLRLSWTDPKGVDLDKGKPLFYLLIRSTRAAALNSLLYLNNKKLMPEVYTENGTADLNVSFRSVEKQAQSFELLQNQPNPFSEQTVIKFHLPEALDGVLNVSDGSGKQVLQIERTFNKGWNEIPIKSNELNGAGIYYYQVIAGPFKASKKMIIVN